MHTPREPDVLLNRTPLLFGKLQEGRQGSQVRHPITHLPFPIAPVRRADMGKEGLAELTGAIAFSFKGASWFPFQRRERRVWNARGRGIWRKKGGLNGIGWVDKGDVAFYREVCCLPERGSLFPFFSPHLLRNDFVFGYTDRFLAVLGPRRLCPSRSLSC